MLKHLLGIVVPGSSKLADEIMLPISMMVIISLVAAMVGLLDMTTPVQLHAGRAISAIHQSRCVAPGFQDAPARFILAGKQVGHAGDPCGL